MYYTLQILYIILLMILISAILNVSSNRENLSKENNGKILSKKNSNKNLSKESNSEMLGDEINTQNKDKVSEWNKNYLIFLPYFIVIGIGMIIYCLSKWRKRRNAMILRQTKSTRTNNLRRNQPTFERFVDFSDERTKQHRSQCKYKNERKVKWRDGSRNKCMTDRTIGIWNKYAVDAFNESEDNLDICRVKEYLNEESMPKYAQKLKKHTDNSSNESISVKVIEVKAQIHAEENDD